MDVTLLVVLAAAVWLGYRIAAARSASTRSHLGASRDNARVQTEVSMFAKDCARSFMQRVDEEVTRLRSTHGLTGDVAYQVAVIDAAIWTFSAQNRTTPAPILDQFFGSFWPTVHVALRERFADSAQYFNSDVEELSHKISDAHTASEPDQAAMRIGQLIAGLLAPSANQESFSLVAGLGIAYTTKLTATAQMLDEIGTLVARNTPGSRITEPGAAQ